MLELGQVNPLAMDAVGEAFLSDDQWRGLAARHLQRAREITAGARKRRDSRQPHPILDFLFIYYPFPFAKIEKWHPQLGQVLQLTDGGENPFTRKHYQLENGLIRLQPAALDEAARGRLQSILDLQRAISQRPGKFACGLIHEWAMVYRGNRISYQLDTPLRLSQAEIDRHVESQRCVCTHFDAYRFFAEEAKPLNAHQMTTASRHQLEQPGCLHSNMDLYKWISKCMPWMGSELHWQSFQLAMKARELDMRASPYDVSAYGYEPICVETSAGRAEFELEQRALSHHAQEIRNSFIHSLSQLIATS
ncbi:hypothetical protein [Persicirhabdus sediminis]|uniref:3-methyladenine DNA glycosylase n=1 Tax=Persicirhabdus sediminis TaxID=454144 RepID=A0A8J7MCD5_9BACT|nr:hypothetical protein [Persicirhabdus sediminis]MBK1789890.1 hypothetical protein [Persicirhabdus sediminis]